MALKLDVLINEDRLREAIALFEFVGGNTKDAIRIAINRAAPKARTQAGRAVRQQVRLAAAYVNERLVVNKATREKLSGSLRTPSRGLLLSRFSTDPQISGEKVSWIKPPPVPAGGISVKVKPTGGSKIVKGGEGLASKPFFMVLRGGQLGIVARAKVLGPRGGNILVLHGPSLSQVFDDVRDDILPTAFAEYEAQLLDAMRYLLAMKYPPEAA